jgi:hypothetical protein
MSHHPKILVEAQGGTSEKTYVKGDILHASANDVLDRLAIGSAGYVLTVVSGDAAWAIPAIPAPVASSPATNLGLTYAAGTLTVCSASGAALSASNAGSVQVQGKTAGVVKTVSVVANQTCTDGSAGTMDNARFGLVTAVNWADPLPLFVYAVLNDAENAVCFMLSRHPCATVAPATTSISKGGTIINVSQGDFFALGNPTVTDYDLNPCTCVGSIRATFVGATDSFTISALSATDGIGRYNEGTSFIMPVSVNGATSTKYFIDNTQTAGVYNTNTCLYRIDRTGRVSGTHNFLVHSSPPTGNVSVQAVLPYAAAEIGFCSLLDYQSSGSNAGGIIAAGTCYTDNTKSYATSFTYTSLTNSDALMINYSYRAY